MMSNNAASIEQTISKLLQREMFSLAHERIISALRDDPTNTKLRLALVNVLTKEHDFHAARTLLEELDEEQPLNHRIESQLPPLLLSTGDGAQAVARAQSQITRAKGLSKSHCLLGLARLHESLNDVPAAREALAQISTDDPVIAANLQFTESRLLIQEKNYGAAADSLLVFLKNHESMPEDATSASASDAWFQLAKAYDRMGEYDKAWAAADKGHEPYQGWTPDKTLADLDAIRTFMNRDTLRSLAHADTDFEWSPLFIVGMPRSGTTMLEQILSMHPDVSNGGEMTVSMQMITEGQRISDSYLSFPNTVVDFRVQDTNALGQMYMDALRPFAGSTSIVSNKSLALQPQLGFLSLCVPNCRAIMLYRHPLDNAVSCHTNNLVTIGHRYTTDMKTFGRIWTARRKTQEHWLEHLDIPMMELHYESMVHDQDAETRRLLSFLDVEWEPQCLDFHKSTNIARTISFDQVNRKMYSTSDGRWKHYEKHLGPVIDEVGEYL